MSTTKELTWEEFAHLNFRGKDMHYVDGAGNTARGTILKMETVHIGVTGFVFVIKTRRGAQKFVVSTFLSINQPQQFPNGRVKATNADGSYCIIYFDLIDEDKNAFAT